MFIDNEFIIASLSRTRNMTSITRFLYILQKIFDYISKIIIYKLDYRAIYIYENSVEFVFKSLLEYCYHIH